MNNIVSDKGGFSAAGNGQLVVHQLLRSSSASLALSNYMTVKPYRKGDSRKFQII